MLQEIYFKLSSIIYKRKLNVGKNPQLRLGSTIINGNYMHLGDNVFLGKGLVMAVYPEHCGKENPVKTNNKGIFIGDGTYANRNLTIYCAESVEIGKNVLLGSNILITDNNHGMDPTKGEYIDQPLTSAPTKIGDGCWIGEKACILSGVEIGKKCVIAAGSIVTNSIPDYCIAGGCPAKVIKTWDFDKNQWVKPQ